MAATATGIVLIAGTMTFSNEWYQTGKADFKVAVATMFAAAIFDGLARLDEKAAVGLSIMVLIAATATKFGGKSVIDTVTEMFGKTAKKPVFTPATQKKAVP